MQNMTQLDLYKQNKIEVVRVLVDGTGSKPLRESYLEIILENAYLRGFKDGQNQVAESLRAKRV